MRLETLNEKNDYIKKFTQVSNTKAKKEILERIKGFLYHDA